MIPDEATLMQAMQVIDIDRLHAARTRIKRGLADALKADFERVYSALSSDSEYTFNPQVYFGKFFYCADNIVVRYILVIQR